MFRLSSRSAVNSSAVRAFRSGHSRPCVGDILTRNASTAIPLLPLRSVPSLSYAWPTPSAFSSMTLLLSSPTFPFPTHSPSPTCSRAGIPASTPPAARQSPVSRGPEAAIMSHPWTAPRFSFSGGVRSHAIVFFNTFSHPHLYSYRKRHSVVRHRRRGYLRPCAR